MKKSPGSYRGIFFSLLFLRRTLQYENELTLSMRFLGIVILIVIILSYNHLNAQVTGRERNANKPVATRDTSSYRKKMIGEKYDSLINICRNQISQLNLEVKLLQNGVEKLKTQIKQLTQDYNNWEQNAQKSLSRQQIQVQSQQKQIELDKKIKDLNNQIYSANKNITAKESVIMQLKSQITVLEKEKVMALSKI